MLYFIKCFLYTCWDSCYNSLSFDLHSTNCGTSIFHLSVGCCLCFWLWYQVTMTWSGYNLINWGTSVQQDKIWDNELKFRIRKAISQCEYVAFVVYWDANLTGHSVFYPAILDQSEHHLYWEFLLGNVGTYALVVWLLWWFAIYFLFDSWQLHPWYLFPANNDFVIKNPHFTFFLGEYIEEIRKQTSDNASRGLVRE